MLIWSDPRDGLEERRPLAPRSAATELTWAERDAARWMEELTGVVAAPLRKEGTR